MKSSYEKGLAMGCWKRLGEAVAATSARSKWLRAIAGLAVCVTVLGVGYHSADVGAAIIGPIVTVEYGVSPDNLETADLDFGNVPDPIPDKFFYSLPEPVELRDSTNGTLIGTIENLDLTLDSDPSVIMNFAVSAGNSPAAFNITSATVTFPTLNNPTAFASAGISVTDGSIPGNGMFVNFVGGNTGHSIAEYNGGTEFAQLLGELSQTTPGTITTDSDTGTQVISGGVSSIQSSFQFLLSANDSVAGNGRFDVVPEPSSLVVALLGVLALGPCCRRARRLR